MERAPLLVFVAAIGLGLALTARAAEKDATETLGNSVADDKDHVSKHLDDIIAQSFKDVDHAKAASREDAEEYSYERGLLELGELSAEMAQMRQKSKGLRKSVAALDFSVGSKGQLGIEQENHQQKQAVKAALHAVATDKQHVTDLYEKLNQELNGIATSLKNPGSPLSEDEQFAQLEKQTENVVEWFKKLKTLRAERDKMKAKKNAAITEASNLGLSHDDIAKDLLHAGLKPEVVKDALKVG